MSSQYSMLQSRCCMRDEAQTPFGVQRDLPFQLDLRLTRRGLEPEALEQDSERSDRLEHREAAADAGARTDPERKIGAARRAPALEARRYEVEGAVEPALLYPAGTERPAPFSALELASLSARTA
jgi:hypothetical protein